VKHVLHKTGHKTVHTGASVPQGARVLAVCALAGMLAACAQAPKPLYDWNAYPSSVYAYLKDAPEDAADHVQALEANAQRASDAALPPGFRAHLALLYLKMGLGDKAATQLRAEKQAFPESAAFMDFLLRQMAPDAARVAHPSATKDKSPAKEARP